MPTASTPSAPISPEIQKRLYDETDARFAAKTGIARKLDPKNALDQTYVPQWTAIYNDVKRQYQGGIIAWTHDHPDVAPLLTQASILSTNAATSLDAAQAAKAAAKAKADAVRALVASGNPVAAATAAAIDADQAAAAQHSQDAAAAMAQAADFMQRAKHFVRELIASR